MFWPSIGSVNLVGILIGGLSALSDLIGLLTRYVWTIG
jgi:hypothetical protein